MPPLRTALVLLVLALPAWGADEAPPTQTVAPNSAGTILGRRVVSPTGEEVGLLVDVLVGGDGKPLAGVLDVGGFMGFGMKRVAVAWPLLRFVHSGDETRIITDLTHDEAAAGPEFPGPDGAAVITGRASVR